MQLIAFPRHLRTTLAALALEHETGKLTESEYEVEKARAIAKTEQAMRTTGKLEGDGWSTKRSPGVRHYSHGHAACWWRGDGGYEESDTSARVRHVQTVSGSGTVDRVLDPSSIPAKPDTD